MSGVTGAMMTLQLALLAALISIALSGALPPKDGDKIVLSSAQKEAFKAKEAPTVTMIAPRFQNVPLRAKRYVGWGRRPSLRYSKATSVFDTDNLFNKIYNKYEKRSLGPEAPISNFRELRMKQKVPNAQLLMPHLYNRNNRVPPGAVAMDAPGSDLGILDVDGSGRLTEDDVDALMFLLEDYAKNVHDQQQ